MKKITITKSKELLKNINCDYTTLQLIVNNIILYNSIVDKFNAGEKENLYLMYQLNNQIIKQIQSEKKLNKIINENNVDEDDFNKIINSISNKKIGEKQEQRNSN